MKEQLIKAAMMHAQGEFERAKTNVMVYMNSTTGIGEHPDIVEAIETQVSKIAEAEEKLVIAQTHYGDRDNV